MGGRGTNRERESRSFVCRCARACECSGAGLSVVALLMKYTHETQGNRSAWHAINQVFSMPMSGKQLQWAKGYPYSPSASDS